MTDNELLLAISDMLDKKLSKELEPVKQDINDIKNSVQRVNLLLENEVQSDIKLLAENYVPAAKRYEKSAMAIEAIQDDIKLLKKVVREHSAKFEKVS